MCKLRTDAAPKYYGGRGLKIAIRICLGMHLRVEILPCILALIKLTASLSFSTNLFGLGKDVLPSDEFLTSEGDLLLKHKFSIESSPVVVDHEADMNKMDVLVDGGKQFSCYYPYNLPLFLEHYLHIMVAPTKRMQSILKKILTLKQSLAKANA